MLYRLEYQSRQADTPDRNVYLMALTFPEKHKWVAVLEAIVNHRSKADRFSNAVRVVHMFSLLDLCVLHIM